MDLVDADADTGEPGVLPWFARLSRRLTHAAVPDGIDCAIAAGCFVAFTAPALIVPAWRIGSPLAIAGFGVLAVAPLVVRRRWPVLCLVAVAAVYVASTLAGVRFTPFVSSAGPSFVIAAFTVADRCDRRTSLMAVAAAAVATWAVLWLGIRWHPGQDQDAIQLLAAVPAWIAGDAVRSRRRYRQRLAAEVRHRALEQERRVRAEERLRLSRDVHDVVSHSLSTIAVRSGVARLLLDEQPGEARAALTAIETASRSALDELRQLLRQIRDPQSEDSTVMPTLGDLPALVDRLRRGGLDLGYRNTGQPRSYSAATEMSAYRIAQEALTNVVKHARTAHADVEVAHGPTELTITVTDGGERPVAPADGGAEPTAAPALSSGLGIVGMRERAALLGGQLTAGLRPGGGFAVVARLPAGDRCP